MLKLSIGKFKIASKRTLSTTLALMMAASSFAWSTAPTVSATGPTIPVAVFADKTKLATANISTGTSTDVALKVRFGKIGADIAAELNGFTNSNGTDQWFQDLYAQSEGYTDAAAAIDSAVGFFYSDSYLDTENGNAYVEGSTLSAEYEAFIVNYNDTVANDNGIAAGAPIEWWVAGADTTANEAVLYATDRITGSLRYHSDALVNNVWSDSNVLSKCNQITSSTDYFSIGQKNLMKDVTINSLINGTNTTSSKLYLPGVATGADYKGTETMKVGGTDQYEIYILKADGKERYAPSSQSWLRTGKTGVSDKAYTIPTHEKGIYPSSIGWGVPGGPSLTPAFNLNITNLQFASSAIASTANEGKFAAIADGAAMDLRFNDASKLKLADDTGASITAPSAPDSAVVTYTAPAGSKLVVVANDSEKSYSASKSIDTEVKGAKLNLNSLTGITAGKGVVANVWIEKTNDSVIYSTAAKTANYTAATVTTPTVTESPTVSNASEKAKYGNKLSDLTLTGGIVKNGETSVDGTWAWVAPTTALTVGDQSYPAIFTPNDLEKYNTTTESISVTVSKATPSVAVTGGLTATYGQTLADVSLTGLSVAATVGSTPVTGHLEWMDSSEDVGTVSATAKQFNAKFIPDDKTNYNNFDNIKVNVTVGKATPTISTPPTANAVKVGTTLSDSILNTSVAVITPDGAATGTWSFEGSQTAAAGTMDYTATFTPSDSNYGSTTCNVSVTAYTDQATLDAANAIDEIPATITSDDVTKVTKATIAYDGSQKAELREKLDKLEEAQRAAGAINHKSGDVEIGDDGTSILPWYVGVTAVPLTEESESWESTSNLVVKSEDGAVLSVYTITLKNLLDNSAWTIPSGHVVKVSIPSPDLAGYKNIYVVHVKADGTTEDMEYKVQENKIVFDATSFSDYAIVAEKVTDDGSSKGGSSTTTTTTTTKTTGDMSLEIIVTMAAVLFMSGAAIILLKKKNFN